VLAQQQNFLNTVFGKGQIACFYEQILISNKCFKKYLYLGTRKTLYQKAVFPHKTAVSDVQEVVTDRELLYGSVNTAPSESTVS